MYKLVGEVVPCNCGVGEEEIFKIVCSCQALLIMCSCVFCEMWCLGRVEVIDGWNLGHV